MAHVHAYEVRAAIADDIPTMVRIKHDREDEMYADYGSHEQHALGLRDFCGPEYITRMIEQPSQSVLVACTGGTVVGLGAVTVRPDHVWLSAIATQTSGGGIGSALVMGLLDLVGPPALQRVECEVFERNTPAMKFFNAMGFEAVGQRQSESYPMQRLIRLRADRAEVYRALAIRRP